jgi:bifunctional non-homologous end joining protein LigD
VLYPSTGTTKAAVIEYVARIAPTMLTHVGDRPLSLHRCPDGVDGERFFEKNCPEHRPDWIRTVRIGARSRRGDDSTIDFCVVDNRAGLVWLANLAALEIHPYLHRADAPDEPTAVVFDLDPGAPAGIVEAARVALEIRALLVSLGCESHVKTSGSKGLQVYLPLNTPVTYERTSRFAHAVALLLERRRPDLVVSRMAKDLRGGKILIDWSQNSRHKTTIGAYSLRIAERPTVSTPIAWSEVEQVVTDRTGDRLAFEAADVLRRVDRDGDMFAGVESRRQRLPDIPESD